MSSWVNEVETVQLQNCLLDGYELRATSDERRASYHHESTLFFDPFFWGLGYSKTVSTSGSINKALLNSVNARFVWVYNIIGYNTQNYGISFKNTYINIMNTANLAHYLSNMLLKNKQWNTR